MPSFSTIFVKSRNLFRSSRTEGRKKRHVSQAAAGSAHITEVIPSSSSRPASELWKLDSDLFHEVYKWNANNPDNVFYDAVRTKIEQHKDILEFIPDGPIPFRGIAKGLAHLVKVGAMTADGKTVGLKFAEDILRWVEHIASRLGHRRSGPHFKQTWEDMGEIRKLIEEVCSWAREMLNPGLSARMSANDRILEYRRRFTEATTRLSVLSYMNIADGIDDFSASARIPPRVELPNAGYGSQNKNPCDSGTRTEILEHIMNWINDVSGTSQCFFWLSGDPGIGKSAITASVARECLRRGILWAQFFINRNDARTIDPKIFFPSIADQMSKFSPAVEHAVEKTYQTQPYLINEDISKDQATKLFVDAIRVASAVNAHQPVVIVIDALDETDLRRLTNTVEIFSEVVTDLPLNAKVFISSRAETIILDYFRPLIDNPRVRHIHLSTDSKDSIDEVSQFIEKRIKKIMKEYHMDEEDWGQDRMSLLCTRASGLFIWAVTALEYIRNQIHDHGKECLRGLLDELTAENMNDINNLYHTILVGTFQRSGISKEETNPWPLQRFRRIMGAILVEKLPLYLIDLEYLLDLWNPSGDSVDVEHFVRRLRAVLVDGDGEINSQTKPRVHRSFSDFVTSRCAGRFRVDMVDSHGELAIRCILRLKQLWELETPTQSTMFRVMAYAGAHWYHHLTSVMEMRVKEVASKTENNTIPRIDANNVTTELESDVKKAETRRNNSGLKTARHPECMTIEPGAVHAAFVQDGSMHLRVFGCETSIWSQALPTENQVHSIVFSPNGQYILTPIGNDIYVWHTEGGSLVQGPLKGHSGYVITAFFAPDGKHIVSASADHTIRIWEIIRGDMVSILEGHTDYVQSAVFSRDGQFIVSASRDKTIRVWDIATGIIVLGPLRGHTAGVRFATFTYDGQHILSYDFDHTILVWDSTTGKRVPSAFGGDPSIKLCFSGSRETESYIITPPRPTATSSGSTTALSYSFRLGEGEVVGGVVGGSYADSWIYADVGNQLLMAPELGGLIILKL